MTVPTFTDAIAFASQPRTAFADMLELFNPTVWYRLGDAVGASSAADSSGNGFAATVAGTVTFGQPSLVSGDTDEAALFNGSTGYLTRAYADAWYPTGALTMSAWVKLSARPASGKVTSLIAVADLNMAITESGNLNYLSVDNTGTPREQIAHLPPPSIPTGQAYWVVITDDGATATLYFNGAPFYSTPSFLPVSISSAWAGGQALLVGKNTEGGTVGVTLNGVIDDVAIWKDVALSAAQIGQLYAAAPAPAAPVFVGMTGRTRSVTLTRGKQHELDQIQTGTTVSQLLNLDRDLDPTNAASPYYPDVVPMRPFKRTATVAATTYDVFMGYVSQWPQNRIGAVYADVSLQAVDLIEALLQAPLVGSFPAELAGSRINRVLDAILWPRSDRNVGAGVDYVAAATFAASDNKNALSHINEVALSDQGFFFGDKSGNATFLDRRTLHSSPYSVSQATVSDYPGVGEFAYTDIVDSFDRDRVWNDWTDQRGGGSTQEAVNYDSFQSYFHRPQTIASVLDEDVTSQRLVNYLVSAYKDPHYRIDQITLRPGISTAFWQMLLARDLGDRVTVKAAPPGGGAQRVVECVITAIQHTLPLDPEDSTITWQLELADAGPFFTLDDPTLGVLDAGNVLSY